MKTSSGSTELRVAASVSVKLGFAVSGFEKTTVLEKILVGGGPGFCKIEKWDDTSKESRVDNCCLNNKTNLDIGIYFYK